MGKGIKAIKMDDVNHHILNVITPSGIDYTDTYANIGENVGRYYVISKYPADGADYGWLSPICNLEGTHTFAEYRYADSGTLTAYFDKRIGDLKADLQIAKEESEKKRLQKAVDDIKGVIERLVNKDEGVAYINIILLIQDATKERLANRIKRVSGVLKTEGFNIRPLKYKQGLALTCASPYGVPDRRVSNMGSRNMPTSSFFGGFPMAAAGINDPNGFFLAKTRNEMLIILDQWLRSADRVNSNWFITGLPGSGKSTFMKDFFTKDLAFGTTHIVWDVEQEYIDFANHPDIRGDVIDCAGGSTGRINPLQIRSAPRVKREELLPGESPEDYILYDEENGISDMALHIQNLRVFFKLYFGEQDYTSGIRAIMEEALIECYNRKGITWDTDIFSLKNEDFPIMSDLYAVIEERSKEKGLSAYKKDNYDKLLDLMQSVHKGADQFIWNGHTTIDPKSHFIVFNMSSLLDLDDNIKRAQYLNLMMWCWQRMARDRTEKIMLDVDEGYNYIEPEYTELARYMRNVSKRDRKYEAGLMFITHSVVDLLDPAVKRLGQAIIDNACYKFLMGCDGKNLEETAKLFKLTEREKNILAAKTRGRGILFAGSVRMEANIIVREKFLQMFGKAGGR
jgi:hypothetical protein